MSDLLSIDRTRFNNETYIWQRIGSAALPDRGSLQTALKYLYMDDGPINLPRDRLKVTKRYLDGAERVVIQWLQTRTNGSERKTYGKNALIAARRSRYCCENCGFTDVRTLNFDHVEGRVANASFACLCANCHTIKSRQKDWNGAARYLETSGPWYHGTENATFERFTTRETFLTPSKEDAACYAGSEGVVAQVTLKPLAVKRLAEDIKDLEKAIADARAESYRYLDFATGTPGIDYRVSLHPKEDLDPNWLIFK